MGRPWMFSQLPPMIISTYVLLSLITIGCVLGKECTNVFPPDYATHSFRHLLQTSTNETWKDDVYSQVEKRMVDSSIAKDSSSSLLSRRMMKKNVDGGGKMMSWEELQKQVKIYEGTKVGDGFLKEVGLSDVSLDPDSMYGTAQQTNLEYLLMLDVDNLAWSFRRTAGLDAPGQPYGGWEDKDCELRGHFVGHYMSSSAKMWASTKNETLRQKMFELVSILAECQSEMGNGYLSAFPSELFDRFETLRTVWAPYYTIHKIMAGLLDQYTFAGSGQALDVLKKMVDYHFNRVMDTIRKYSIQRHWNSLNEEVGGMNDVLYSLYSITGDRKHLVLAHLFDKPCFLGELAMKADDVSSFHANTHIPLVSGAQMRYEVTGDPLYREIATYFVEMINSSHTYATGGTSENEHWTDPNHLATSLTTDNEETCSTYNMLKVTRNLFRWTKDPRYADYYERTLINGILPVQRGTEPGVMIYFIPLKPGGSKAVSTRGWGHKYDTFWCCYGTATESFAKLGDTIYFEGGGKLSELYIVQYIPNKFQWTTGSIKLEMKVKPVVSWYDRFLVTITMGRGRQEAAMSTLHLRMPAWTDTKTVKAQLNDKHLLAPAPDSFLSITKKWIQGDQIKLELPISLRLEAISDDRPEYASLHAILYGPYVLAGLSKGDNDIKAAKNSTLTDWITPVLAESNDYLISLLASGNAQLSLAASPESVRLQNAPRPGTNEAVDATLRLILRIPDENYTTPRDAIGKSVMLEPYGHPGMVLAHQGANKPLQVIPSSSDESLVFNLVVGLDGATGTVSFQSENQRDCYISSSAANSVALACKSGPSSGDFNRAASFKMDKGISDYHPLSFVAKGATRSYLLAPLLSLRDEQYTVYFNI